MKKITQNKLPGAEELFGVKVIVVKSLGKKIDNSRGSEKKRAWANDVVKRCENLQEIKDSYK